MFKLSISSTRNSAGVDPKLLEVRDLALTITLVDFGHGKYAGLRSVGDQQDLHASGASPNCDGATKRSKHQDGKALDFYAFVDGKASWGHDHLAMVALAFFQAAAILGYRIKWGGLWKSRTPKVINGIPYGWDCPGRCFDNKGRADPS